MTESAPAINLGVEDLGDFVLGFSVDLDQRGRSLDTSGNGVRSFGLKLGDMEYGVDSPHGFGKTEGEGVSSGLSDDLVRAQKLLRELLRGASGTDELGTDIGVVSDLEVRSWQTMLVGLDLVTGLSFGNMFSECGVEFVEVYGELLSPSGGEVTSRMDG